MENKFYLTTSDAHQQPYHNRSKDIYPLAAERHIYIYIYIYIYRTAPLTSRCCILYIIQQIYVQNILNMLHTLRFYSSECRLFHNATFFGSCVVHILYTGCAKI